MGVALVNANGRGYRSMGPWAAAAVGVVGVGAWNMEVQGCTTGWNR